MPGDHPDADGGRHPLTDADLIAEVVAAFAGHEERPPIAFEVVTHGRSGDLVARLRAPVCAFVKVAGAGETSRRQLEREADVLDWLQGRCAAPRPLWSGEAGGRAALLIEAAPGVPLHELAPADLEAGVIAAVRALAALHALPVDDCPFDARLDVRLAEARRRTDAGEVDEADFDAERLGRSAADVLAEVLTRRPPGEDLAVTHGDACWPNFIVGPDGVAIVDVGRLGVADRHQDLALFLRSAAFNAPGLDTAAILARHYPLARLDPEKYTFFQMLDEFF